MRPFIRFQTAIAASALFFASLGEPSGGASGQTLTRAIPAYRLQPADMENGTAPTQELDDGGPYQALCVRTCDGFYFPLRQNARRQNFPGDDRACRSSCGSEARLFYFPVNGGKPATMVDLEGRKYTDEPHAFAFRSAIVPGCACHAAPWSEEAAARHRSYAAAAVEQSLRREESHIEDEQAVAATASAAISAAASRAYYGPEAEAPDTRPAASPFASPAASDGKDDHAILPAWQRPTFRMPALRYNSW